ncbi:MAG: dTDP-4-dehydrorhamnose 3,5-epimerase family protein, partial [Brevinematia bacterium]
PEGFAHGFLAVSDYAEIIYKVSGAEYSPKHDAGIRWDDPDIGIKWPLEGIENVILSDKDSKLPYLKDLKGEDLL